MLDNYEIAGGTTMFNTGIPTILAMAVWARVLLIILAVVVVLLVVLMIVGSKMQKKQLAQKEQLDAMAQTMSMLVIDKKIMRLCDAQLPKEVMEQTPKYMRKSKVPFVKVKVGPRIMTLMADPKVYEVIPVKKEIKAVVSGIYITEIKSVRGGSIPQPEPKKKKGLFGKKKDK
jgi:hypothetical protein